MVHDRETFISNDCDMRLLTGLFIISLSLSCYAKAPEENRLTISQGIGSPDVANLVNVATGYTSENPAGVMYQDGYRASLQLARGSGLNDIGFEGGASSQTYGLALGYYSPACSGCAKKITGILGAAVSKDIYVALRYQSTDPSPTYGVGFLFNAKGTHRFGLTAGYLKSATPNSDVTSLAGGYAYVTKSSTIALDVSKSQGQAASDDTNKLMVVSLGYQKRIESLQLGVTFQRTLNSTAATAPETIWIGGGFNGETWHLGVYNDMNQQFMAVLSAFLD